MSNLDSIKDAASKAASATESAFVEWFAAKPWCMAAIMFVCLVAGFVVGKIV